MVFKGILNFEAIKSNKHSVLCLKLKSFERMFNINTCISNFNR